MTGPAGTARPDGPRPDVRVGIVSYRTPELLDACLGALPGALDGLTAEVVVWDNAPGDGSAEVARRHGAEIRGAGANVGYAAGMNGALEGTAAPVLIALNPDTVPQPRSLRRLVDVLCAHDDAAIAAPRLVLPDGDVQQSAHRFPWLPQLAVALLAPRRLIPRATRVRLLLPGTLTPDRVGPVDWAIGAVHVMRRAHVGPHPYRERWFMYVEDLDLCWRMSRGGHRTWFVGDADVVHVRSASAEQVFGDDPSRRWWGETYDWYTEARGDLRCRLYALLNALAAIRWHLTKRLRGQAVSSPLRPDVTRHLQVVRRGAPSPAAPPPADTATRPHR